LQWEISSNCPHDNCDERVEVGQFDLRPLDQRSVRRHNDQQCLWSAAPDQSIVTIAGTAMPIVLAQACRSLTVAETGHGFFPVIFDQAGRNAFANNHQRAR
jgi:hypothetical protein